MITRREFIKKGGILAGAGVIGAAIVPKEMEPKIIHGKKGSLAVNGTEMDGWHSAAQAVDDFNITVHNYCYSITGLDTMSIADEVRLLRLFRD